MKRYRTLLLIIPTVLALFSQVVHAQDEELITRCHSDAQCVQDVKLIEKEWERRWDEYRKELAIVSKPRYFTLKTKQGNNLDCLTRGSGTVFTTTCKNGNATSTLIDSDVKIIFSASSSYSATTTLPLPPNTFFELTMQSISLRVQERYIAEGRCFFFGLFCPSPSFKDKMHELREVWKL